MIRQAIENDEQAIRACAEEAYAPYIALIGRKPAPMLADYRGQIAAGHVHVVTDVSGRLLGFIVFFAAGRHMLLENVAVCKAASGQGIGKSLMQFCEREALRLGLVGVRLYTNEKMTDNLAIYPRLGYREVERRVENGFNRVFFEKTVGACGFDVDA